MNQETINKYKQIIDNAPEGAKRHSENEGLYAKCSTDWKSIELIKDIVELWESNQWISVADRLPEGEHCHCLVVRYYHNSPELAHVCYAFFTKDREFARSQKKHYSRKIQGKLSVHFDVAEAGFIVTHWKPIPNPPQDTKEVDVKDVKLSLKISEEKIDINDFADGSKRKIP